MGRLIRKKGEVSLSVFCMKYFLLLLVSVLPILIAATTTFQMLMAFEMIYPANYAEQQIREAEDNIRNADTVDVKMIPELCKYAVFDNDGKLLQGNMVLGLDTARAAKEYDTSDGHGNYYKSIPRDSQYCVVQYQVVTQYRSPLLRKVLPKPLTLFLTLTLLSVSAIIIVEAIHFGKLLKRKLQPIVEVATKVKAQELEFKVEPGNIKEINEVLQACDDMKVALNDSLKKEWEAQQIRREQISALAHDLRTPLTIIRGNAEILADTQLSDEQKECAGYIEEGTQQISEYLSQLILATKSQDAVQLQKEQTELAPFLDKIQREARGLCVAKGISLLWENYSLVKSLMMDATMLKRAIVNVLSNAVDHTPQDGGIRVTVSDEGAYFCMTVSDSGTGFTKEALKYATKQFYMDEASRTSRVHYGMGLYIADTVVRQHGGEIVLKNAESGGAQVGIKIMVKDDRQER